jgi:hypothetical protein
MRSPLGGGLTALGETVCRAGAAADKTFKVTTFLSSHLRPSAHILTLIAHYSSYCVLLMIIVTMTMK